MLAAACQVPLDGLYRSAATIPAAAAYEGSASHQYPPVGQQAGRGQAMPGRHRSGAVPRAGRRVVDLRAGHAAAALFDDVLPAGHQHRAVAQQRGGGVVAAGVMLAVAAQVFETGLGRSEPKASAVGNPGCSTQHPPAPARCRRAAGWRSRRCRGRWPWARSPPRSRWPDRTAPPRPRRLFRADPRRPAPCRWPARSAVCPLRAVVIGPVGAQVPVAGSYSRPRPCCLPAG